MPKGKTPIIPYVKTHFITVIGLIGAILIIIDNAKVSGNSGVKGDLLIFLNATSFGLYLVLVKPLMHKYSPIIIPKTFFVLCFSFRIIAERILTIMGLVTIIIEA